MYILFMVIFWVVCVVFYPFYCIYSLLRFVFKSLFGKNNTHSSSDWMSYPSPLNDWNLWHQLSLPLFLSIRVLSAAWPILHRSGRRGRLCFSISLSTRCGKSSQLPKIGQVQFRLHQSCIPRHIYYELYFVIQHNFLHLQCKIFHSIAMSIVYDAILFLILFSPIIGLLVYGIVGLRRQRQQEKQKHGDNSVQIIINITESQKDETDKN